MKRRLTTPPVLALTVLLSLSLACSFLTGSPATPAPQQQQQQQQQQPPDQPTAVPQQDQPTAIPPTEAPPPTQANPQFFTEEFDNGADKWKPFVTHGNMSQLDFSVKNGSLVFDMKEKQLWGYAVYQPQTYTDVKIEVQAENFGNNENNVTLVCRYSDRGWYEVSIANSGLYWIYFGRWDDSGTSASYAKIADGGSNNIKQGQAVNTYGLSCKGNTITVYINDKEIKRVDDNQRNLGAGQIGIGLSSFRYLPVEVHFDWVRISQP